MYEDPKLIGATALIVVHPSGEEQAFLVGVGTPHRQPAGEWACPALTHDFREPRPIYGEDSLQALCLALSFIRLRLEDILDKGGRLLFADGRREINRHDIDVWFSRVGRAGAG